MAEYTPHQRKVIERYYDQRDAIMLTKLSDLVTELFLAETDKKRQQLWQRVEKAMKNLKVPETLAAHVMQKKSPEILAQHVKDWLARAR